MPSTSASRSGARLCDLWWGRDGVETDAAKIRTTPSSGYAEGSTIYRATSTSRATRASAWPSSPSPTSPAVTFIADRRPRSRADRHRCQAGELRAGGRGRPLADGRAECVSRRRPSRSSRTTVRHAPQRPEDAALRSGPAFGCEDLKEAFFIVKLLEDKGYPGAVSFDASRLPLGRPAGGLGLRRGQHADLPHPSREGAEVQTPMRRSRACSRTCVSTPSRPRRRSPRS